MPEIKLTEEEMKMFLMIKKKGAKEYKKFLSIFCVCLESDLFEFPKGYAGQKILHWDKDGNLRQIDSHKIDWKSGDGLDRSA